MNFHAVATEIMLHANDEKWQETHGKIVRALEKADRRPLDWLDGAALDIAEAERKGGYVGFFQIREMLAERAGVALWRDQPDGVR